MIECDCEAFSLFECIDCAACTNCIYEYYMVTDQVWLEAHPNDNGKLCIGCLEQRLGKKLAADDFTACPLNDGVFDKSDRLLQRLGKKLQPAC